MSTKTYISVILPLKLEWIPCYHLPEKITSSDVNVGDRVKVTFANKEYVGVINSIGIMPETSPEKIRAINSIEKGLGRILPQEIALWNSVAEYYMCSIGEVYKAAYPIGKINLEEARAAALEKAAQRRDKVAQSIQARIERIQGRRDKKLENLEKARKESTRARLSQELEQIGQELELAIRSFDEFNKVHGSGSPSHTYAQFKDIELSSAQEKALEDILKGFSENKPVLLHGVTGSGKTEIYMKLAQDCMKEGRNVLYLVPEIALSHQLEDRLYGKFGDRLLTFHSGESAASRRNTAETIREACPEKGGYILLGTRSSLFLPHHDLGLIIVDEEQDSSYKQDSPAPRYNGRDTALMLHRIHKCNILLGSATPSLEEVYNCASGKHIHVGLTERFHGSVESQVEIIDTKAERKKNGMVGSFSRKLIEHINATLAHGEQVIILRSRRAWASAMQCEVCGEIVKCPHCNVSLSLHNNRMTVCHYCGYSAPYRDNCRKCGGVVRNIGAGTQRVEEEAASLFPQAKIARLDSDSTQNKKFEAKTIRDFASGKIDILIGTQMVTKGFDFSNLTLVAVIAADSLLGLQDFRADEKAIQILEQFRGRCGRRSSQGLFVIQSSQPEHPVYQKIASNQTAYFSNDLLLERKDFDFPPFSRIIEICIKDNFEDRAVRMSTRLADKLRRRFSLEGQSMLSDPVTGPYSPVVDKVADQFLKHIRVSMKKDRALTANKAVLWDLIRRFETENRYDGHITINVDPS